MARHYGPGIFHLKNNNGDEYKLTIGYDESPDNPRSWDGNTARIWCWKTGYQIDDDVPDGMTPSEAIEYLCSKYNIDYNPKLTNIENLNNLKQVDWLYIADINCYEHSGMSISTSHSYPYNDRWDSSQIGFAFVDKSDIICTDDENWKQRAQEIIDAEVEILNYYVQGDVYGYLLEKLVHHHEEERCPHCGEIIKVNDYDSYEEEDSVWGFYGSCLEENGITTELPPDLKFDK